MIVDLCNVGHEHHVDAFDKIAVFAASSLPYFSHISSDAVIEDIITNIPDGAQVFLAQLLRNNINVVHRTQFGENGKQFNTTINFTLTPQDKNLQELLNTYNGQEVAVLVSKVNSSHLYGTKAQPLLFTYAEQNSPSPNTVKGYSVEIKGVGYGPGKLFESVAFNIYERGLAFELAQEI